MPKIKLQRENQKKAWILGAKIPIPCSVGITKARTADRELPRATTWKSYRIQLWKEKPCYTHGSVSRAPHRQQRGGAQILSMAVGMRWHGSPTTIMPTWCLAGLNCWWKRGRNCKQATLLCPRRRGHKRSGWMLTVDKMFFSKCDLCAICFLPTGRFVHEIFWPLFSKKIKLAKLRWLW